MGVCLFYFILYIYIKMTVLITKAYMQLSEVYNNAKMGGRFFFMKVVFSKCGHFCKKK